MNRTATGTGLLLCALALGCGTSDSSSGDTATTTGSGGSSPQSSATTSTSGGDGGSGGAGSTSQATSSSTSAATGSSCFDMCMQTFAGGVADFQAVLSCVFCVGCYDSCQGVNKGCQMPPASVAPCDALGTDCVTCTECTTADADPPSPEGVCASTVHTCDANPECASLRECAETCPAT